MIWVKWHSIFGLLQKFVLQSATTDFCRKRKISSQISLMLFFFPWCFNCHSECVDLVRAPKTNISFIMKSQQHSFYISMLLFLKRETVTIQMLTIFWATVLSSTNETESSNTRRKHNSLATRLSPSKLRVRWVSDNCGVYPEHHNDL